MGEVGTQVTTATKRRPTLGSVCPELPPTEDLDLEDYHVVKALRGNLAAVYDRDGRFVALAGFQYSDVTRDDRTAGVTVAFVLLADGDDDE